MKYSIFRNFSGKHENNRIKLEFYRSQREKEYDKQVNVYIYRQTCTQFEFGTDYEEFIYSLDYNNSTLIYEGIIEEDTDKKYYVYNDYKIEEGITYAYYLKSEYNDVIYGPILIKCRNRQLWMPYNDIENKMNTISKKYKQLVNIKLHGKSIEQREIRSITIGNINNIELSFIGLIHAGESGPELMIHVIEKLLKNNQDLLDRIGIAFLMNANPDQREKLVEGVPWYLRKNSNEVDINRNFESGFNNVEYGYGFRSDVKTSPTYRGIKSNSEPETRTILDFINYTMPKAVFIFHSLSSICTDTFLVSKYCKEDRNYLVKCNNYLKPYTKGFGVKEKIELHYATSYGSLPHLMYDKYNIPAFDMELGQVSKKIKDMVIHDKVTLELLEYYREKHYKGILEVLKYVYS